jgi:hypothetical protein
VLTAYANVEGVSVALSLSKVLLGVDTVPRYSDSCITLYYVFCDTFTIQEMILYNKRIVISQVEEDSM